MITEITGLNLPEGDRMFDTGNLKVRTRIARDHEIVQKMGRTPDEVRAFAVTGSIVDDTGKVLDYDYGPGGKAIQPAHLHTIAPAALASRSLMLVIESDTEPASAQTLTGPEKPLRNGHCWRKANGETFIRFEGEWVPAGVTAYGTALEKGRAQLELNLLFCRLNCTKAAEAWWTAVQIMDAQVEADTKPSYAELETSLAAAQARIAELETAAQNADDGA